jgi:hypothetical protein
MPVLCVGKVNDSWVCLQGVEDYETGNSEYATLKLTRTDTSGEVRKLGECTLMQKISTRLVLGGGQMGGSAWVPHNCFKVRMHGGLHGRINAPCCSLCHAANYMEIDLMWQGVLLLFTCRMVPRRWRWRRVWWSGLMATRALSGRRSSG